MAPEGRGTTTVSVELDTDRLREIVREAVAQELWEVGAMRERLHRVRRVADQINGSSTSWEIREAIYEALGEDDQ